MHDAVFIPCCTKNSLSSTVQLVESPITPVHPVPSGPSSSVRMIMLFGMYDGCGSKVVWGVAPGSAGVPRGMQLGFWGPRKPPPLAPPLPPPRPLPDPDPLPPLAEPDSLDPASPPGAGS
jgi:hypothetical protein